MKTGFLQTIIFAQILERPGDLQVDNWSERSKPSAGVAVGSGSRLRGSFAHESRAEGGSRDSYWINHLSPATGYINVCVDQEPKSGVTIYKFYAMFLPWNLPFHCSPFDRAWESGYFVWFSILKKALYNMHISEVIHANYFSFCPVSQIPKL